jgi:ABC transporter substrate binding protein (PQQ-dependent alcohol dehydrogenase system)
MTLRGNGTLACAAFAMAFGLGGRANATEIEVPIIYLHQQVEQPPVLSNLDPVPEDLGMAGAETALKDNKTTGGFLGHQYSLDIISVDPGGDFEAAAREALAKSKFILVDASAAQLLSVADLPEAKDAMLFNVSSEDAALRSEDCRANVLHTATELAQRSDALMQVLQAKQWRTLVMIVGPKEPDKAFAAALRTSAAKFGLEILAEKEWTFDTDLRESTMQEIPRFTQDFPDHDVLLIADETDDFGRYVEHNAWLPRPVAGSDGMVATAWSHVIEAWGAVQLQNRFEDKHERPMRGRDYAAWVAVRAMGEAVTRTNSADPAALRSHLLKPDYQQDGFKGRGLSFRAFNGQLRQPIAVVNARALVTLAPVEGFLHPVSEMDTLGLDAPESRCKAFGG